MTQQNPWITDRPPEANDTNGTVVWCVEIIDRSGPIYMMRWDDAEVQEFCEKPNSVVAWRSCFRRAKEMLKALEVTNA
jgi:hypothetical protein